MDGTQHAGWTREALESALDRVERARALLVEAHERPQEIDKLSAVAETLRKWMEGEKQCARQ